MQFNQFVTLQMLWLCFAQDLRITKIEKLYKTVDKTDPIFLGAKGHIKYVNDALILYCNNKQHLIGAFEPIQYKNIKSIFIHGCILPLAPLKEELLKINITTDKLETLEISSIQTHPLPSANYTAGLTIKHLLIQAPGCKDFLKNNPEILKPLLNLTVLHIDATKMPPIPSNIHLEALSLVRSYFTSTVWENCKDLQELNITGLNSKPIGIPKTWPVECKKLRALTLKDFKSDELDIMLKSGINTDSLQLLYLENSNLQKIPKDILWSARNTLKHLSFYRNKLKESALTDLVDLPNVTEVDFSRNNLDGTTLSEWSKHFKNLRNLNLDKNSLTDSFCYFATHLSYNISTSLTSLERLSLNEMPELSVNCLKTLQFTNLVYLGLASKRNDEELRLQNIPQTNATQLFVDLRGRNMTRITFELEDYKAINKTDYHTFWGDNYYAKANINLTLSGAMLDCECENYWLAHAMHESLKFQFNLSIDFTCRNGVDFLKEPTETMDCIKNYIDTCTLKFIGTWESERKMKDPSQMAVDCHNNMENFKYPYFDYVYYKLISLNVSDNQITSLQDVSMSDTSVNTTTADILKMSNSLQWIDLRGNRIARLDKHDMDVLFTKRGLRVWLSRNQIICDCENKYFIDMLHGHREQIVDFDNIICVDSGNPLNTTTSYEVCQITLKITLGILAILALLFMTAAFIVYRFKFQVKIYLYSRGLCLSCLREEDLDSDRPFDAFLSFAHGDTAYIVEHLMPKLEGESENYRILVHYRDWVVGDWIPAQIMKSIQLSKRTIIVLSKNFVGSLWGSLEFKYAVASAAQEGRKRLLVLILDDVLLQEMDPELTAYIAYNTYLSCDDPWFWEKLRYAMPHKMPDKKKLPGNHPEPEIRDESPQLDTVMMRVLADNNI